VRPNWLDRAVGFLSPGAGLQRIRARVAGDFLLRHYEGAASGRRTQGWKKPASDANASAGPAIGPLRQVARDLVRNNAFAESALTTIMDHVVGWGIVPKPRKANAAAAALWDAWAGTTACDADGRNDFYGLQKLVMRTVIESGEVLIRRRIRKPEDGFPIPMQLQVLDPDYLDTAKHNITLPNLGRIVHGVEFDAIGRRVAYWLFKEHPGSEFGNAVASAPVPAESVLHIYRQDRPGQVRGVSWFAPVMLAWKDFDDFDDATMMKQKVAACLAVVISDPDGSNVPLGTVDSASPYIDSLEPGAVVQGPPGRTVEVVQPPSVRDYPDYVRTKLRAMATGIGISYEDLTGDYTATNFSSARMSRLRHWARVEDWRWRMLVPQLCIPAWRWMTQAAAIMDLGIPADLAAEWTGSPLPMIDPSAEGLAYQRNIRSGLMSLSEALRERGYDPDAVLAEMADDNEKLDELGLILDSDPRRMTQAGQAQAVPGASPASPTSPPEDMMGSPSASPSAAE
jgi:lambda family phage portal protein